MPLAIGRLLVLHAYGPWTINATARPLFQACELQLRTSCTDVNVAVTAITNDITTPPAFLGDSYDVNVLESQDVNNVILTMRVKNANDVSF